jgi:MFS family permease
MIVPTALALVTSSFAEDRQHDRPLGVFGTLLALGFRTGLLLGGVLTNTLGWRSTMGLSVVMGALVLMAAPLLLTESRGERQRLDVPGAVTITGGLLARIGYSRLGRHGGGATTCNEPEKAYPWSCG